MAALPPTGPPLALIVTEPLRVWLFDAPLRTAGAPDETGMAGVMLGRPFTGEADGRFPFCAAGAAGAGPPTTMGGLVPVAVNGVDGFFVEPAAEAYDGAAVDEEFGAGFWVC